MRRIGFGLVSLLALAMSTNLYAEEVKLSKWYGGVGLGGGDQSLTVSDFDDGSIVPGTGSVATEKLTNKFFAGYTFRFKKLPFNILAEGGYLRLPNVKFEGVSNQTGSFWGNLTPTGTPGDIAVTGRGKADGITLAGILDYPIWRGLHVQGKVGLLLWDTDTTYTNVTVTNSQTGLTQFIETLVQTDNGVSGLFGLGFEYNFLKRFGVRVEYEQYRVSYKLVGDSTWDTYSASFLVRF